MPQLPAIRTGLQGLETSLSSGAQQVDSLASVSAYPVVHLRGHPATHGATAAALRRQDRRRHDGCRDRRQGGGQGAGDPRHGAAPGLRGPHQQPADSRPQSRHARHRTSIPRLDRTVLVKSLPETAARLAEDLPQLSRSWFRSLRETRASRRKWRRVCGDAGAARPLHRRLAGKRGRRC